MKKLNKYQVYKELKQNFSFYKLYKLFMELYDSEDAYDELDITFKIIHKGQVFHIDEKSYNELERYKLIKENLNKTNRFLSDLVLTEDVLIFPTNPQYKLFPRIKGLYKKVKKICPSLINFYNAYGAKLSKQELSEKLLNDFLIIPFLFSYMDINIIPYNANHFYFVNHHMDIFEVTWIDK